MKRPFHLAGPARPPLATPRLARSPPFLAQEDGYEVWCPAHAPKDGQH